MTAPSRLGRSSTPGVSTEMLDTTAMSRRLAGFLNGGPHLRLVEAKVLGRATGPRVVVAYQTVGPEGSGPVLIGKVYADRERARRLHALLVELHALELAGHECGVTRPIALISELGMSVYVAARGRTLDQLEGAERSEGVVAAAHWLAAMHGSGIGLDRRFDLAVEMRNLTEWAQHVAYQHPSFAKETALLLSRLGSCAQRIQVSNTVPIHKDFQYRHVLADDGRVTVIDLDEARVGDPAFDVAHFGANLRLLAIREGAAHQERAGLESVFQESYVSRTGYRPDLRHNFFRAYACLKIAKQLVRGRGPEPVPTGLEMSRQLDLILGEGLRCLPA
jgi:hypothetical protein